MNNPRYLVVWGTKGVWEVFDTITQKSYRGKKGCAEGKAAAYAYIEKIEKIAAIEALMQLERGE